MGGKNVAPPQKGGAAKSGGAGKVYSGKSAVANNGGGMGGGMNAPAPKKFGGSGNVSNAQVAELEGQV